MQPTPSMASGAACELVISSAALGLLPVTQLFKIKTLLPEYMKEKTCVSTKYFIFKLYSLPQILPSMCNVLLLCGNIADISPGGLEYYIKQTMRFNF